VTRKLGIGIIGLGWMGEAHSRAYRQVLARFSGLDLEPRLVMCSDNVESRARDAQYRLGFERFSTDWRELINDPEVEIVDIAAPNGLHLELVRAAAEAGKHIFCEKPVGKEPRETALCEQAARQAGVQTFVGYNYRWAPLVQYARQLVQEGRLGRLTYYRSRFFADYASNLYGVLSWRFEKEHGLGILSDLGSHAIDLAHMLVGPISKTVAMQDTFIRQRPLPQAAGTHFSQGGPDDPTGDVTNEDFVGMLMVFENGVQGSLEMCRAINGPKCEYTFELYGTQGAIKWNFEQMNQLYVQFRNEETPAEDGYTTILSGPAHPYHHYFNPGPGISLGYDDLKTIEAYHFLKSIAGGQQGEPGFAEALAVANVQTAVMRSWESERWEKVKSIRVE
jgi:predicted dehydrogenase